ncbi:MAG: hypothetical protein PHT62_12355 [Desulfotomaculaceae bacterium]|nr:hypothetical protein [Desulfotomaculaceae bacterium]
MTIDKASETTLGLYLFSFPVPVFLLQCTYDPATLGHLIAAVSSGEFAGMVSCRATSLSDANYIGVQENETGRRQHYAKPSIHCLVVNTLLNLMA